jgi:ABC-type branched-subunit amino acid transport system ATPase component/ABC-type branched-subunit amino acid transport system permease subunit
LSDFFTFVVAGITIGSLFALVGAGLVLTYRTSGVLNFAQGALAIVAVDLYIYFTANLKWSWEVGSALAVVGGGLVMGFLLELLGRVLARVPQVHQVVATVGLLIAIESASALLESHIPGSHPRFVPPPLPSGTVSIGGVNVGEDQIVIMGVALFVGAALWAFLSRSRMGLSMRAVVANADLLDLCGRSPIRVRRGAWVIGATFAALSGVILSLSPTYGLSPDTVNLVILPAFAAAAVAGFSSLPLAFAGGLFVGIVQSLLTGYVNVSWLLGLPSTAPYIILFMAVVVIGSRRMQSSADRVTGTRPGVRAPVELPPWAQVVAGGVLLGLVLAVPMWAGFGIDFYTTTLIFVVLFLSLGLLVRSAGMVSLCQLGFAAVGATTFGRLATNAHLPWFLALAFAMVAAGAAGALVGLPAIRLSGAYLGLATLAFGYILEQLIYPTSWMFGQQGGGSLTAPRPFFATTDHGYYYLVGALVAVSVVAIYLITHNRLGRLLRGLADSPLALQAQGASTNVTRLLAFSISAAMAGLAGALLAGLRSFITGSDFSADASLTLVAVLFVVRLGDPWYALAAAVAYYFLPEKLPTSFAGTWVSLAFGALAVFTVVRGAQIRPKLREVRAGDRTRQAGVDAGPPRPAATAGAEAPRSRPPARIGNGLEVAGLTVRFGGVTALDAVSLHVPPGSVTGLIGPNGAGKTTLLNVCSGLVRASAGTVLLDGRSLERLATPARARWGLGRTFQHGELFESMSVFESVALSHEAAVAGRNPLRHVAGGGSSVPKKPALVDEAIAWCGLEAIAHRTVGELSTAERRVVELARCLSWPFAILLLDEPTAGLDRAETQRFGDIIDEVVRARGIGVLIVEHDIGLVFRVCSNVAVLDFGRLLFQGDPSEVMASDAVRAAYLGQSFARGA